jgi:hypothetical protein
MDPGLFYARTRALHLVNKNAVYDVSRNGKAHLGTRGLQPLRQSYLGNVHVLSNPTGEVTVGLEDSR